MKKTYSFIIILFSCLLATTAAIAQTNEKPDTTPKGASIKGGEIGGKISTSPNATTAPTRILITSATLPIDLARAAYAAQGGDKFRDLKSMVLSGSVELFAPNSLQSVPGKFAIVTSGDRSRTEFQSPVFSYRQISDGTRTYTSVPQMEMPPPNKFGISVLMKYDQSGYTVSALPDNKKLRAFRITDSEGFMTDFYVDPATGRVMSFVIPYKGLTYGVENKSFKEIDGVLVPMSFTERLEMRQGAAFADFKTKDVKLNQELGEDMFEIPEQ